MAVDGAVQEQKATEVPSTETQIAVREEKPLTRTGAMGFGLVPRNFDEAWRMAGIFAKSELVPKAYRDRPEDIVVAMAHGAEVDLPPMASLQSIAVINGKPGLYGDGFLGVIMSKPAYAKHKEFYRLADGAEVKSLRQADYQHDETAAVALFWRKGNPDPFVAEFSIGDAKRAKLWGKEGPWTNYPARQMLWRARGFAGRNGFAAELRGIKTAEELLDTPEDIDVSVSDLPPAEPVRRSEKALAAVPQETIEQPAVTVEPQPSGDNGANPDPPKAAVKPKPAASAPIGPGQLTKNVRISGTAYVGKPKPLFGDQPYYEIKGEEMVNGRPKIGRTWMTQDEQLYKLAASCEGSESLFTITWHQAPLAGGTKAVAIVTAIAGA